MIVIALRFMAGRFHATPWGRHINEGIPEWPPSPWRLLRTFVSVGMQRLAASPSFHRGPFERLIRSLAAEPPQYALPPTTCAHSRHYMPWFKEEPHDKTLIFDTFVNVSPRDELGVIWPHLDLPPEEHSVLAALLSHLAYLGRAESWCEARLLEGEEAAAMGERINCLVQEEAGPGPEHDPLRLLCPDPQEAFASTHTILGKGKGSVPLYDPDWHLCLETLELHGKRWSDPPGARWMTYAIKPTVARFALDAAVLPTISQTLPLAEQARRTLMGLYRRVMEGKGDWDGLPKSRVFSGKDADGSPLQGHQHSFYIPTDEDGDGYIDHLTVFAQAGFDSDELRAIDGLRLLKREESEPIGLILLALGNESSVVAPLFELASTWVSATPFLTTRHQKARGRKKDPPELLGPDNRHAFARQVLLEELGRLRQRGEGMAEAVEVEPLNEEHRMGALHLRPLQFKRFRQKRDDDGGRRPAGAFRIVFSVPVRGPLCLGHSAHFGMGLFLPER